jgi:tRNA (cmo5U34)-methyltransferase
MIGLVPCKTQGTFFMVTKGIIMKECRDSIWAYDLKKRVETYDRDMDIMHPNRNKMSAIATDFLPYSKEDEIKAFELGIGTGFFTESFLNAYPKAKIVAVDGAAKMLELAKERLGEQKGVDYRVCDFTKIEEALDSNDSYDVIFTSFALHHLDDSEKTELLHKMYAVLKPGGWFINADIIIGPSILMEERNQQLRVDGIVERARLVDDVDERFLDKKTTREMLDALEEGEHDQPITMQEDIRCMHEAGFKDVAILWKEYREVVFAGYKRK